MKKYLPQNWNDVLALILIILIPLLWVIEGRGTIKMDAPVDGALIVTWTLIIQYYFRKAPPEK